MDDRLLSLWCQMRLALRRPCETGLAWIPVRGGTVEFAVEDTRSGIRAVHECVAEARSNGSTLFDVGREEYSEMRAASLHSGFIMPLTTTSSTTLRRLYDAYENTTETPCWREFLSSVFVINPFIRPIWFNLRDAVVPENWRILRWALSFNGECGICFADYEPRMTYHLCAVCAATCCHRCWRSLRREQRTANVRCPSRCDGVLTRVPLQDTAYGAGLPFA
mmetsp:Transcript_21011/g.49912  ORF Transcript_21011/g.49912 Transcript_21011/m.49912 type:complete len:221 (-) Transcript_21011:2195-2857(-)